MTAQDELDLAFQEVAGQIKGRTAPAGLNFAGAGRVIYITHDAVVPAVPPFTQIIRLPAA
jgi:hypothetical protein